MFKIIYMKADYEPWWKFDGWEDHIVSVHEFEEEKQFQLALTEIMNDFRQSYANEACKNEYYYAFWSEDECEFCEACDEDAQIYHGIILQTPDMVSK
ncbi:DUF1033 domain-containing protein [Lysinibacillus sp. 2017]|uniref:DUF1033 family protein n=1 Tax=unclassified Lysinibacillus TaxID=2636778 RepID=UPI000D529E7A|nr:MULTISPECIES: DUF1033 family protein [unclassified Lysinibacillus]AWE07471.1 DUF1033 domain-containing protein [Lysinibacillus sp. 2017]TGN36634.1 DUF1033 family protein [Lysinibacillus sp. S2017]